MHFSQMTLTTFTLVTALFGTAHTYAFPNPSQFPSQEEASLINQVAVFPHDGRQELTDPNAPWGAIGLLDLPDGTSCTASLIGPNLILTNSHCVADAKKGQILKGNYVFKVQYRRGRAKASSGVKRIISGGFRVSHNNRNGDWAVLILKKRLGDRFGWLGIAEVNTADLLKITDQYKLYMAGYAHDRARSEVPVWQGNCSFYKAYLGNEAVLTHDCSTTSGASGSPMFIFTKAADGTPQARILAIHSGNQFAADKDVAEKGKMVAFSDTTANLAVHSSEFIETVRTLRAQED